MTTQSLQEKAVKEFDEKFSGIYQYDVISGCGDSECCDTSACVDENIKDFISSLVAEVVDETEKRVREEMDKNLKKIAKQLKNCCACPTPLKTIDRLLTPQKEEA